MDISVHEGEIPIPISSNYVGGSGSHAIQSQNHHSLPFHHHHHPPNIPSLPLQTPNPVLSCSSPFNSKKTASVKYRECLKNHAASIGGNATDGCGEFMPSGEEGTLEALKCSACSCHRNFHRKEVEGDQAPPSCEQCFNFKQGKKLISQRNPFGYSPTGNSLIFSKHSPHSQMIIPFSSMQTSESDEMEGRFPPPMVKKRFRTKFTAEQKDKMLCFAERAGWRLQKQEESAVQELCNEIGVKRRVLKVWMHNNKHNLAKKTDNLALD